MDRQTTRSKPRFYPQDYTRQVVDLVVSSGRTPTAVAGEVGLLRGGVLPSRVAGCQLCTMRSFENSS